MLCACACQSAGVRKIIRKKASFCTKRCRLRYNHHLRLSLVRSRRHAHSGSKFNLSCLFQHCIAEDVLAVQDKLSFSSPRHESNRSDPRSKDSTFSPQGKIEHMEKPPNAYIHPFADKQMESRPLTSGKKPR